MKNKKDDRTQISIFHPLRVRLLLLVVLFLLTATILLEIYTLRQFEKVTTIAIEHEGNLLSDLLETSITPYLETHDIEAKQANLDRIAATRERNDIEMNIMLLDGEGSATVASNVPSNIEGTDPEEYDEL